MTLSMLRESFGFIFFKNGALVICFKYLLKKDQFHFILRQAM